MTKHVVWCVKYSISLLHPYTGVDEGGLSAPTWVKVVSPFLGEGAVCWPVLCLDLILTEHLFLMFW